MVHALNTTQRPRASSPATTTAITTKVLRFITNPPPPLPIGCMATSKSVRMGSNVDHHSATFAIELFRDSTTKVIG